MIPDLGGNMLFNSHVQALYIYIYIYAKMKGAEVSLLSGVEAPNLATVEQCADDTCPIDCNFGVRLSSQILKIR